MGGLALIAILAVLAGYFLYTPDPELPRLSGAVTVGSMVVDGSTRKLPWPTCLKDWRRERH